MRVTGGNLKGYNFQCPHGIIRPAMDKMREAIFAILGDISNHSFLDLFSGSGIIAIEAASRGSNPITLCEKDKLKISTVLKNITIAEKNTRATITCKFIPVELFIKRCKSTYDIIFCDPPFPYKFHSQLIESIGTQKLLNQNGVVIIHHPSEKKMPNTLGGLNKTDTRIFGRSIVDFYSPLL